MKTNEIGLRELSPEEAALVNGGTSLYHIMLIWLASLAVAAVTGGVLGFLDGRKR
jgi:hypothetical protein